MKDDRGLFKRMVSTAKQSAPTVGSLGLVITWVVGRRKCGHVYANRKFCSAGRNFGLQV